MRVDCVPTKFLDETVLIKWCILLPLWVCSLVSGRFMGHSHDLANSECYYQVHYLVTQNTILVL